MLNWNAAEEYLRAPEPAGGRNGLFIRDLQSLYANLSACFHTFFETAIGANITSCVETGICFYKLYENISSNMDNLYDVNKKLQVDS